MADVTNNCLKLSSLLSGPFSIVVVFLCTASRQGLTIFGFNISAPFKSQPLVLSLSA
jgi:hypothetical protein